MRHRRVPSGALISVAFTGGPFGDLALGAFSFGGDSGCNNFRMAHRLDEDPASAEGAGVPRGRSGRDVTFERVNGDHTFVSSPDELGG